jgi:hypothetical protein
MTLHVNQQQPLPHLFSDPENTLLHRGSSIEYRPVKAKSATFKGGQGEPAHRWFRLTPSFGPDLVRDMATLLNVSSHHHVLDPFAGAGTTLIECQAAQIRATGIELNPLLQYVTNASLDWTVDAAAAKAAVLNVLTRYDELHSGAALDLFASSPVFETLAPKIKNRKRWWRDDILIDLVALKYAISSEAVPSLHSFLTLAFTGVLVPDLTNVVLSRLQLYLTDKSHVHMDVRTRLRDTLISCCRISPRYSVPITRERHALLEATLPSRTSPGANCPRMRQSDNWRRSQRAARRVQCR